MLNLFYLLAAVTFILALKMLASPKTAVAGNLLGASGMLVAIIATLVQGGLATRIHLSVQRRCLFQFPDQTPGLLPQVRLDEMADRQSVQITRFRFPPPGGPSRYGKLYFDS